MNAIVITLAKLAAIKAVKCKMLALGVQPVHVNRCLIVSAANAYLRSHPELVEAATETVRKVPQLRTLAERRERERKRKQRWAIKLRQQQTEHCGDCPMPRIGQGSI